MRCASCDCRLPVCGGEEHPALCRAGREAERHRRSLYLSSLAGWPANPAGVPREKPLERAVRALSALPGDCRVNVGFVSPTLYGGGAERWILTLMRSLNASRFRVAGLVVTDTHLGDDRLVHEARSFGPVLCGAVPMQALGRACAVVIGWGVPGIPQALGAGRKAQVVIVSHGHGPWARKAAIGCEAADLLVAVSPVAVTGFPADQQARAVVIPNGVDLERLRPTRSPAAVRADHGLPPDAQILLIVARLSPEKRVERWAEAVAELPEPWRGVCVGDGQVGYADELRRKCHALAPSRLTFAGFRHDVGDYYGAADSFVLPSDFEGHSLAVTEAWAAGVPVVSTEVGVVRSGEHADLVRLVPTPCSGRDIARAVLADQAEPERTMARVQAAREIAREHYSATAFARRWEGAIDRLLKPPKVRLDPRTLKPPADCVPCGRAHGG